MQRPQLREVELGFGGDVASERRRRLINKDGSFNVARRGLSLFSSLSLYHSLVTMSWRAFLATALSVYLVLNVVFAIGFCALGPEALGGVEEASAWQQFLRAFFFSVQTSTTIGYGHIVPGNPWANVIVTIESFIGLGCFAIFTGLLFARFSRPTAKLRYSRRAVVAPYRGDGGDTGLMFRVANLRKNQLIDLGAKVFFSRRVTEDDGTARRAFAELPLERRSIAFFPLSWTIVHPIGEDSPLAGVAAGDLVESEAEFLILITGIDDTFNQMVHSLHSYTGDEVDFGRRFQRIFTHDEPERYVEIDLSRLDETEAADLG